MNIEKSKSTFWITPIRERLTTDASPADIQEGWENPSRPGAARSLGVTDSEGRTIYTQVCLDTDATMTFEGKIEKVTL